ncbi:MAG TPA: universal stress protein [Kofleriaceae bacterium]|nr:universal stress protein [Kofleriaceae bacterium]
MLIDQLLVALQPGCGFLRVPCLRVVFERIVVAYDGSQGAEAGARFAFALGEACRSLVTLVDVVALPNVLPVHAGLVTEFEQRLREDDRHWWQRLEDVERAAPAGLSVESKLLHGRAAGR